MKRILQNASLALLLVPLVALGVSVVQGDLSPASALTLQEGADAARGEGQSDNLFSAGGIFQTVTNILLFLIGAVSVIMLIIGGIRYVVSGGDQAAVTAAKNTILYAIVGIIVAFLAYAAVSFVINQLGAAA